MLLSNGPFKVAHKRLYNLYNCLLHYVSYISMSQDLKMIQPQEGPPYTYLRILSKRIGCASKYWKLRGKVLCLCQCPVPLEPWLDELKHLFLLWFQPRIHCHWHLGSTSSLMMTMLFPFRLLSGMFHFCLIEVFMTYSFFSIDCRTVPLDIVLYATFLLHIHLPNKLLRW